MECILPMNQPRSNAAITTQPQAFEGEDHLRGPQPNHLPRGLSLVYDLHQPPRNHQDDITVDVGEAISAPINPPSNNLHPTSSLELGLSGQLSGSEISLPEGPEVDVGEAISAPINPPSNNLDPTSSLELGLSGQLSSSGISLPEGPEVQHTGSLQVGVDSNSGSNQSNPILHLLYLAAFNLVFFFVAGVSLLSEYLSTIHPTYMKVMHIMIFGVPITLAAISLSMSRWLACYPAERGNWITGLLVANYSMYGVHAGLLALKHGTGFV